MNNNLIQEKVYLYSIWGGKLKIYQGNVHWGSPLSRTGTFVDTSRNIKLECSNEPKSPYNSVVWLDERNDNLAKAILIMYEEAEISILQEKIEHHVNMIKTLKGDKSL